MRQYTILVDMDEVLENLGDVWIDELNQWHGTSVRHEDITEWDMTKFFPMLSRNQVFAPLHDEATWKRVEPLPGAQECVRILKADGHDVVVVSASHPDTVKWKYEWLARYFPNIPYKDIVFCSRKQLVKGDFLIDDAPHNLFGGTYMPIMFAAPHNRAWKPHKLEEFNCYRTDDWYDTLRLIRYIAEKEEK